MYGLEQALKGLVTKLTGREAAEMPNNLEGIVGFATDHYAATGGEPGAVVTAIQLQVDGDGKVVGGSATRSDGVSIPITVTPAEG